MKKLLFILLFTPLISIAQTWKADSLDINHTLPKTEFTTSITTGSPVTTSLLSATTINIPITKLVLYGDKGEHVDFDETGKIYINYIELTDKNPKVYELIKECFFRQLREKDELKGRFLSVVNMPNNSFNPKDYDKIPRAELIKIIERQDRQIQQLFQINRELVR